MNFRKILSVLLTFCMLCGVFSSAFTAAASDTPSYTVVTVNDERILVYDSYYEILEKDIDTVLKSVNYSTDNIVLCGQASHVYLNTKNTVHFHDFIISVPEDRYDSALFLYWGTKIYIEGICSFSSIDEPTVECNEGDGVSFNPTLTQNSSLTITSVNNEPIYSDITTNLVDDNADEHIFYSATGTPAKHKVTTVAENDTCVYACEDCDYIDGAAAPHNAGDNMHYYKDADKCASTCVICGSEFSVAHELGQYRPEGEDSSWCAEYCTVCDTNVFSSSHTYVYTEVEDGHTKECEKCHYSPTQEAEDHIFYYYPIDGKYCIEICDYCGAEGEKVEHTFEKGYYTSYDENFCMKACDNCYGPEKRYATLDSLKPHDFSSYEYYDEENCVLCCSDCGQAKYVYIEEEDYYDVELVPHKHETAYISATDVTASSSLKMCENCGNYHISYDIENSIEFSFDCYHYATTILVFKDGKPWQAVKSSYDDVFYLPFNSESTYEFKLLTLGNTDDYVSIGTYNEDGEYNSLFEGYLDEFELFDTVCSVNLGSNETEVLNQISSIVADIPFDLAYYTEDSVKTLVDVIKKINIFNLPSKLSDCYALIDELRDAVNGLEAIKSDEELGHGYIFPGFFPITITDDGYTVTLPEQSSDILNDIETSTSTDAETPTDVTNEVFFPYVGDYTIINPYFGEEFINTYHNSVTVDAKDVNITLVNALVYDGTFDILPGSNVNLTLVGSNTFINNYGDNEEGGKAGIHVSEGASLTITDCDGSLIAVGENNTAGIGGQYNEAAGDITINGGYVFAFSSSDGAGIGGGYNGGISNITINGGYIFAQCLLDDGAGIGCGDDGNGGNIIINDGRIFAISDYDDGAGIGGADDGQIDSITINGGIISVSSDDGAGIGGGEEEATHCGTLTINGGVIAPHRTHDLDECLVGNGNYDSPDRSESCYVIINGGNIISDFTRPVYPTPENEKGEALVETHVDLPEGTENEFFCFALSDGSKLYAKAFFGRLTIYIPENVTIKSITEMTDGDVNGDGTVNAADALVVLQASVGKISLNYEQNSFANVNGDNAIAAADALNILQYAVGKITEFAK